MDFSLDVGIPPPLLVHPHVVCGSLDLEGWSIFTFPPFAHSVSLGES